MSTDCSLPKEESVIAAVHLLRYGDAGNPIQSVVLAAASGANTVYFANHDLAMEEADVTISTTGGEGGAAARQTMAELVRSWL
jgi:hypothetical protein